MSVQFMSLAYSIPSPHLTPLEKFSLISLTEVLGDYGGELSDDFRELRKLTNIDEHTQVEIVNSLIKKGFLTEESEWRTIRNEVAPSALVDTVHIKIYSINLKTLLAFSK